MFSTERSPAQPPTSPVFAVFSRKSYRLNWVTNAWMAMSRKWHVCLIVALSLLVTLPALLEPTNSQAANQIQTQPSPQQTIVLDAAKSSDFNIYNTNGTAPAISGNSTTLYASDKTDVYSDIVSYTTVTAQKNLVLQASAAANVKSFSSTGGDQFAIFAADDTSKYKGDEFGFVLPETGDTWYAYIQSPHLPGWFIWTPVLKLDSSTATHSLEAVYSKAGLLCQVDFYVDGKQVWATLYPNVSSQNFHMALCSHKVSSQNIDISQNMMTVQAASFTSQNDSAKSFSAGLL